MNDIQKEVEKLKELVETHSRLLMEITSKLYSLETRTKYSKFEKKKYSEGDKQGEEKKFFGDPNKPISKGQLDWLNSELNKKKNKDELVERILNKLELAALDRIKMGKFNDIMNWLRTQ